MDNNCVTSIPSAPLAPLTLELDCQKQANDRPVSRVNDTATAVCVGGGGGVSKAMRTGGPRVVLRFSCLFVLVDVLLVVNEIAPRSKGSSHLPLPLSSTRHFARIAGQLTRGRAVVISVCPPAAFRGIGRKGKNQQVARQGG